jgi:glutamyl-tRNA synthetase
VTVRVRVAPSPTGYLHVGNARAALFNWLFARHHGGQFILRVDDTDQERSTVEYEADILDSLRWLGLDWDEGVEVGGSHGTYRQSDRFQRYRDIASSLVDSGAAYYDDRMPEELEALRQKAQSEQKHPGHYIRRPERQVTSGVIRMAVPQDESIVFEDLVRGTVAFEPRDVDDFVILRSDRTPTYHLASTVDDVDYQITHVARGEDLLPSTPKHILLTRALGASEATYAHLPLLFGPDGKKLSKRHGETALSHYRDAGHLPDAVFNYLSLLGWSIDGETTIFSREEAIKAFDLTDVSSNPAIFDPEKLAWLNGEYVRMLGATEFRAEVRPYVESAVGRPLTVEEWERFETMSDLVQERTRRLPDAGDQVVFLFEDFDEYAEKSWDKVMTQDDVPVILDAALARLGGLDAWSTENLESALRGMLEEMGISPGKGLQPLRVALTGSSVSPPLFESMAALGKEKTLQRLQRARGLLSTLSEEGTA